MGLDLSVYGREKTVGDYMNENEDRELKKMLVGAQAKKAMTGDFDDNAKTAILKAAMGLPLDPQEQGYVKAYDAMHASRGFDPVTGAPYEKPSVAGQLGLGGKLSSQIGGMGDFSQLPEDVAAGYEIPGIGEAEPTFAGVEPSQPPNIGQGSTGPVFAGQLPEKFAGSLKGGNRKLQQVADETRLKNEIEAEYKPFPTDDMSKAAGFSDRLLAADKALEDVGAEGTDLAKTVISKIPGGNYAVGDKYQKFEQAQRDFINAQLRRESGAAIAASEFENARRQYFPQPGDTPAVIAQKAQARKLAIQNMGRSAGPNYKPAELPAAPENDPLGLRR